MPNPPKKLRIVLTSIGTLGDVNPLIAICLELKRRGHTPVLAVPAMYIPFVEPLGIEIHPIRPEMSATDSRLAEMIYDIRKGTERGLREFLFPVIRETFQDTMDAIQEKGGADLLVAGELNYSAPIIGELLGIPWVSYVLAPVSFFSAYDPPALPMFPSLSKADKALPMMGHVMKRLLRLYTRKWAEPVYQLRESLGLERGLNPLFVAKHSPYLVMVLYSKLMGGPQPDWPKNAIQPGFVFYDGDAGEDDLSPELKAFLAAGPPPVAFTLGSAAVLTAGKFYEYSARAAEMLGIRAVLLVGRDPRNVPKHPLPDTIFVTKYAPFSVLFPHCAAVVHQGGIGTTSQALRAGIPTLVMPYSHDQPDNARRVRRLGASRTILKKKYTPKRVMRRLKRILNTPRYKQKALQAAEVVAHEDAINVVCDQMEQLVERIGKEKTWGKA
jgi:UDP:flavonoid glycosyltransferase YjiC (YdhE family)